MRNLSWNFGWSCSYVLVNKLRLPLKIDKPQNYIPELRCVIHNKHLRIFSLRFEYEDNGIQNAVFNWLTRFENQLTTGLTLLPTFSVEPQNDGYNASSTILLYASIQENVNCVCARLLQNTLNLFNVQTRFIFNLLYHSLYQVYDILFKYI